MKSHPRAMAVQCTQEYLGSAMIVPMVIAFSLTILLFGFESGSGERTKSM